MSGVRNNDSSNYSNDGLIFLQIGLTSYIGSTLGGFYGGAIGLASGLADKYLIDGAYCDRHFISSNLFWNTLLMRSIGLLPISYIRYKYAAYFIAPIISTLIVLNTDDFFDIQKRLLAPVNSVLSLSSFLSLNKDIKDIKDDLDKELSLMNNQYCSDYEQFYEYIPSELNNRFILDISSLTFLQLADQANDYFFLKILGQYASGMVLTNIINSHKDPNYKDILNTGFKITGIFLMKNIIGFLLSSIKMDFQKKLFDDSLEQSTAIILHNDQTPKLLHDSKGKEVINNLNGDISSLLFRGIFDLNDQVKLVTSFSLGLLTLTEENLGAVIVRLPLYIVDQISTNYITAQSKQQYEDLSKFRSKVYSARSSIIEDLDTIILRDAQDYTQAYYTKYLREQTGAESEVKFWSNARRSISYGIKDPLDQLADISYFGYRIVASDVKLSALPLFVKSVNDVFSFLSANANFYFDNTDLILSQKRINYLYDILSTKDMNSILRLHNGDSELVIGGYSLHLEGKPLIEIEHLAMHIPGRYAVTGRSGCGKSSFLRDIKHGIYKPLSSTGSFSYPLVNEKQPLIMFLDQNSYIPQESTLLEASYFPSQLEKLSQRESCKIKQKVIRLFKELEIDEFVKQEDTSEGLLSRLDKTDFQLSGGQSKKIAVIQAILNKPDILIADEILVGLDKRSIVLVENAIMKYLPNIMLLSVDHHPDENNYNSFYDYELYVGDDRTLKVLNVFSSNSEITFNSSDVELNGISIKEESLLGVTGEEKIV